MKVFVAGATGVVGWRAVRELVAAGHEVSGLARTPAKAAQLAALGAEGVHADPFDLRSLGMAFAGHDAVVNLMTRIPPAKEMARVEADAALAVAVGRDHLRAPLAPLGRALPAARALARSQRVSNDALREATGWAPEVRSQWKGW